MELRKNLYRIFASYNCFGSEIFKNLEDYLVQPLIHKQKHLSLDLDAQALSNLICFNRACTTSLGNRSQNLTTLIIKNFFFTFNLSLPSHLIQQKLQASIIQSYNCKNMQIINHFLISLKVSIQTKLT